MNETSTYSPAVEADQLTKVFRDFWGRAKVRAVNALTFAIRPGEVFGLLGPNGSGKSTTLKLILGLLFPTAGRLRVLGHSPRHVETKRRIGYLPEDSILYPNLSAEEILHFYGRLFDLSARERRERIDQLLAMMGLAHARRRLTGEFSKGMARRIGMAQALINDPDLIALDEPTSGLDPVGCREMKDLIRTLAGRGKTVILSSHLLADVENVCDRIAILCNGNLIVHGTIRELLEERDRHRLTLASIPADTLNRIIAAIQRDFHVTPEIDHPTRTLEQFFLDVVDKARKSGRPASGVEPTKGIAPYLAGPAGAPDILAGLVAPPPPEPASATSPRASGPPVRHLVRRSLGEGGSLPGDGGFAADGATPPTDTPAPPSTLEEANRKLQKLTIPPENRPDA